MGKQKIRETHLTYGVDKRTQKTSGVTFAIMNTEYKG